MSVPQQSLFNVIATARDLERQGYFERVRQGDQKAASLFARLVAHTINSDGDPADFGWLSKSPGESQVDGFAEDAICFSNDPSNLENVVDMVNGAGAPGASIAGSVKERRTNNRWVTPAPLTSTQLLYLRPSGIPPAPPPPPPPREIAFPPRNETAAFAASLNHFYQDKGRQNRVEDGDAQNDLYVDNEGLYVWIPEYLRHRVNGLDHVAATKKALASVEAEWR